MKKLVLPLVCCLPLSPVFGAGLVVDTFSENWATDGAGWTLSNATIKDIETTATPGSSHNFVDLTQPGNGGLTGKWLFTTSDALLVAERTITTAAAFDNVSLTETLVAVAGGMDLAATDFVKLEINGTTIFDLQVRGRNDGTGGYLQTVAGTATISPATEYINANTGDSEFLNNRIDGWGMDTLFDLGLDPAFDDVSVGALTTSATIRIETSISNEGVGDEAWGVNNLEIAFSNSTIPEPSASALFALVGAGLILRRRR